jgi:hypothetical protein
VRWAARDVVPLTVEGPGFIDCHLYRQGNRLILHLVNLTNAGTWRAPVYELIPVGPLQVRVKLPEGLQGTGVRSLISGRTISATKKAGLITFEVRSLLDHEVMVIG